MAAAAPGNLTGRGEAGSVGRANGGGSVVDDRVPGGGYDSAAIGGQAVGGHKENPNPLVGKAPLPRVPTNMPTNEKGASTIDPRRQNWQTKRGWIEWTARETKNMGKRRYPRRRRWEWNGEKWVKSTPTYSLNDFEPIDEADYVKLVERRERAKRLGF